MHVCMYACMNLHTYLSMYACIHTHTHMMHVCIIHIHFIMHVCIHTYAYPSIHPSIHTHTHADRQTERERERETSTHTHAQLDSWLHRYRSTSMQDRANRKRAHRASVPKFIEENILLEHRQELGEVRERDVGAQFGHGEATETSSSTELQDAFAVKKVWFERSRCQPCGGGAGWCANPRKVSVLADAPPAECLHSRPPQSHTVAWSPSSPPGRCSSVMHMSLRGNSFVVHKYLSLKSRLFVRQSLPLQGTSEQSVHMVLGVPSLSSAISPIFY